MPHTPSKGDPKGDTPQLLINASTPASVQKRLISLVEVVPGEDLKIHLGVYDSNKPPYGILIEFDPHPGNNINAELIPIHGESSTEYELKAYLVNYGFEPITVEIWELTEIK